MGEDFLAKELQTKDLDNTLSRYWISPAGELFAIEWGDAVQLVPVTIMYNQIPKPFPFRWEVTGENKKLSPVDYTGAMTLIPMEQNGVSASCYREWPRVVLLFDHGKIIKHEFTPIKINEPN